MKGSLMVQIAKLVLVVVPSLGANLTLEAPPEAENNSYLACMEHATGTDDVEGAVGWSQGWLVWWRWLVVTPVVASTHEDRRNLWFQGSMMDPGSAMTCYDYHCNLQELIDHKKENRNMDIECGALRPRTYTWMVSSIPYVGASIPSLCSSDVHLLA